MSTAEQVSLFELTQRVGVSAPAGPESFDHPASVPAGSGSFRVTPLAVPGPLLVTVIVKPSGSPAFKIGRASCRERSNDGFRHAIEYETCASGAVVACAVAVLS